MKTSQFLPLSAKEFHILLALSGEPQNGYRIVQLAEENSRGAVKLSPATQYMNIHRLAQQGLVEEVKDGVEGKTDGRRQRFWCLTKLGARVLRAEAQRLAMDARLVGSLGGDDL